MPCNAYSTNSQHFFSLLHMYYFSQHSYSCNYTHLHKGITHFFFFTSMGRCVYLTCPNSNHPAALAQCLWISSSSEACALIKGNDRSIPNTYRVCLLAWEESYSNTVMQHCESLSHHTTNQSLILMAPEQFCWGT